ncbi:nucleotide pyrophosphohydrolase [Desulfotruncus alcoholivorax]|uniref:nucleotide pyrophosphohydrolase n=1 Tax=Desulfotruncus alcoholivorax TaxID=265477 RepID=UPI0003FB9CAA|nr:nucleotide pyrophosphohydrolase [Desulfotruncus alcoholivorax]
MPDRTTHIQELKDLVACFVQERNWNRFHSSKNLSMSIAIEAAELMELFQWADSSDLDEIPVDRVREELSDVIIYCLSMANALEIDITDAVRAKVRSNAQKYPIDRYKGKYK